jgi:sRNA-binding carbon storage regulator CsrA
MMIVTRKLGESIVIGDTAVTVALLAENSVELALARTDGMPVATVTVGQARLTDLVRGVQAVVLSVDRDKVRLGLESPVGGQSGADEWYRD